MKTLVIQVDDGSAGYSEMVIVDIIEVPDDLDWKALEVEVCRDNSRKRDQEKVAKIFVQKLLERGGIRKEWESTEF